MLSESREVSRGWRRCNDREVEKRKRKTKKSLPTITAGRVGRRGTIDTPNDYIKRHQARGKAECCYILGVLPSAVTVFVLFVPVKQARIIADKTLAIRVQQFFRIRTIERLGGNHQQRTYNEYALKFLNNSNNNSKSVPENNYTN